MAINKIEPRVLKGFRDYSGSILELRDEIQAKAKSIAKLHGFEQIVTPYLEYSDVLLGEGGDTDKQVFKFMDQGDREVALRYDLTMPFARYVAQNHGKLILPYKKLQIGTVFRGEKPQKGRYREFMQCDFDVIGSDHWLGEYEVISCLLELIKSFVKSDFIFELGHREVLSAIIRKYLGDLDSQKLSSVFIGIDKLDKIPVDAVASYLHENSGLAIQNTKQLLNDLNEPELHQIDWLKANLKIDSGLLVSLQDLENALKPSAKYVRWNFKIARGLAYYTGLVFETFIDGHREIGSICSGGRYAHLTQKFGVEGLSGFGGSLGIDRFVSLFDEESSAHKLNPSVFVAIADAVSASKACEVAKLLRENHISVYLCPEITKLNKQLRHADRLQCSYVLIVGENEVRTDQWTLKDMKSGSQASYSGISKILQKFSSQLP